MDLKPISKNLSPFKRFFIYFKNNQIISGWTLTNKAKVKIFNPENVDELKEFILSSPARTIISRGLGRSYGDAAQLSNATIVKLDHFNKIVNYFIINILLRRYYGSRNLFF